MFGTVKRGPKHTRFRLAVTLDNGCEIYEVILVSHQEMETFPDIYGFVLDRMTDKLQERINERSQLWANQ